MHLDQWERLVLLEREVQMVGMDLKEAEECQAWQDPLELLADKGCLAELETLVNLVKQEDLDALILKMI